MDLLPLTRHSAAVPPAPPPRILQFGGGNFLRAFADWMVEVMNEKTDYGAGIIVVKPTPGGSYQNLDRQEGLYHVGLRGREGGKVAETYRLIACITETVSPYSHFERFLQTATIPGMALIVSNTTEAGITYRVEDRLSDVPAASFPGKLTQWLYHRFRHFTGNPERGVVVLPCELIEKNGDELQQIVRRLAAGWNLEKDFLRWLEQSCTFCNTLVDRIVPGAPAPEELASLQKRIGFTDRQLVLAEPYHLWVIEGGENVEAKFPAPAAGLNVRFVDDLTPFRTLKVRILNGAHTAMVPVGLLSGLTTVREALEDPRVGPFIHQAITEEIIPSLGLPAAAALDYAEATIERFLNPFLHHRLADIALNSTAKFTARLLPTFEGYYRKFGRPPERLTLALSALIRFYGPPWQRRPLPVRDTPEAVAYFQRSWQRSSMEEVAQKALDYWPFSMPLKEALEQEVPLALKQWGQNPGPFMK